MAALTGLFIADSYKALLKTIDNDVLGAAAKEIVDGYGNVSGVLFDTSGNVTINGNFRALDAILDSSGNAGTAGQVLTTTGTTTQWQSLSSVSGVTGSGTAGYLPLWSTDSALTNSIALQSGATITIGGTLTATTKINTPILQLTGGIGTQGTLSWNADEETVDLVQNGTTTPLNQATELHVKNQTGATIAKGTPVRASGTLGASGRILIAPMIANGTIEAKYFLGVTNEAIADGEDGKVITFGKIRSINTAAYTEGQTLWVSATTAGAFTTTRPVAPNLDLEVAIVINSHVNNGVIFVRSTVGHYLGTAHDVNISSVAENDLLVYKTNRWVNTKTIGDLIAANVTLSGYLRGPATFVIDPSAYGDETGLVQILGDLRVDGTTTTINSTTISVSDKNITLAKDAATAGDANGAGITIAGANATLTYLSATDDFTFNKVVNATGFVGPLTGNVTGTVSTLSNHDTDDLDEGTTNLYFTTARARDAFSAGTGVAINAGEISIGQSVGTTDNVTFGVVTASLSGNASTASALATARNIALDGSVTGNADFDGSGNITITTTTNHNHDDRYYTETEVGNFFSGTTAITGYNKTNWDSAYSYSQIGHLPLTGGTLTGDLTLDDKLTITGTTNNFVIDEEADGTWHLYDTFQDNGIVLYSGSGGMDFQYNGVTEMTIDGSGVSFTGTINLDAADLNIGSADIIFDTVSGGAVRGLIWNVAGEGFLSKITSGGIDSGKVTIYTNIGTTTVGSTFEIYGANGLGLSLSNSGILTAGGGTSTQWNTAYTYSQVGHLPLTGGTMSGNINWGVTDRGLTWGMNTDGAYIKFFNTGDGDTDSRLEYATSDNGNEYHRFMISGTERMKITETGITATGYNKSNWDTAYGWGNHASAGYVTDITTQTDPKYLRSDESDTMTGSLTINASGVGLNVSSDFNTGLIVNGGTNSGIITEFKYGTTKAVIKTSGGGYFLGDVGVGFTEAPTARLEIKGSDSTTSTDTSLFIKGGNSDGYYNNNQILFGYANSRNYAHAIKTRHQSGSVAGNAFDIYTWKYGDAISTPAGQHVMTIQGNGVGIGTTNPSQKFEIADGAFRITETGVSSFTTTYSSGKTQFEMDSAGTDGFYFRAYSGSYANRLVIRSSGKIGIGIDDPVHKLDVAGSARVTAGIVMNPEEGTLYSTAGTLSIYGTNNGVYLNGAGNNGFLRLNASGVENSSNAIDIYGANAGGYINLRTGGNPRLHVANSGHIGINTTGPTARLSVFADGVSPHASPTGISVSAGSGGANLLARDTAFHNWLPFTDGANYYSANAHTIRNSTHTTNFAYIEDQNAVFNGRISWSNATASIISNQLQSGYNYAGEDADFWINYTGYQGGASYFRDFRIGNGKQGLIAFFDGSTSRVGIGTSNPQVKLQINDSTIDSGGSAIHAYGFDGAANLYTSRGESPYNAALYLYNNPISGQGYGTGIIFRAKSDVTISQIQGSIYTTWTTATDASRTSRMVFTTTNSGTVSEKVTILGNGNFGIGTDTPFSTLNVERNGINEGTISYEDESNNAHLTVSGADAFVRLQFGTYNNGNYASWIQSSYDNSPGGSGSSGAQGLAINPQGGNVGIGMTNPGYKLQVSGVANANDIVINNITTGVNLRFQMIDGNGGIFTTGDKPLYLGTNNTSNHLVITSAGNVGINKTNPGYRLDVEGDARIVGGLQMAYENSNLYAQNGALSYYSPSNGVYLNGAGTNGWLRLNAAGTENDVNAINIYGAGAGGYIQLRTAGSTRLHVVNGGNIGIGTDNPATKLHVKGSGNYDGAIAVDNSTTTGGGVLSIRQNGVSSGFISVLGSAQGNSGRDLTYYSDSGLGHYFYVNDGTMAMRITSGANIGVGLTNPDEKLHVNGNIKGGYGIFNAEGLSQNLRVGGIYGNLGLYIPATYDMQFSLGWAGSFKFTQANTTKFTISTSGTITATGDVLAYSDARVKENVETIDNALDKVVAMRGVSYNRTDSDDKTKKVGVIAQEVQKVLPEVVTEQEDGMLSVSYGNIVGVLIEAIKEQQKQIDELKALLNVSPK